MGEKKNACMILVGKPERKRLLGRPKHKWVKSIKVDLGQIKWSGVDWIDLAHDGDWWRVHVNAVLNLLVP
jgi:hypothetical protein